MKAISRLSLLIVSLLFSISTSTVEASNFNLLSVFKANDKKPLTPIPTEAPKQNNNSTNSNSNNTDEDEDDDDDDDDIKFLDNPQVHYYLNGIRGFWGGFLKGFYKD